MLEKLKENSILYDFYGALLPQKQREIFSLYYEDNYSLAEIAQHYGITRQGVHEAVKRSEKKLQSYEDKLGLKDKFKKTEHVLTHLSKEIDKLILKFDQNEELITQLHMMKDEIKKLNQ
ncbi:MAG: sigma-70 family RNA polymerase sigma factor [Clostridiales bacterium]|jgi:predicted DNA-binding protein YlxM (UPF0122 family)|nr:sigma-70 family RNA polymerase sigma factor [Clostridiales bacterium]